jgi:corrinoid protein of di/trimethylamine methyltransferase
MTEKKELFDRLAQATIDGEEEAAARISQEIIDAGIDPIEAIQQGAKKGLDVLGDRFQRLEAFIPELILGSDAMKASMAVLLPHLKQERGGGTSGKVVIGTVSGDIHEIGKSLVGCMLMAAGFEVYDLGYDVSDKRFIEKAEEVEADVIALSALLSLTANHQGEILQRLKDMGMREKYFVIVGGGPVNASWAKQIKADGYGRTAVDAVKLVKRLLSRDERPSISQTIIVE